MPVIQSTLDTAGEAFQRNRAHMLGLIQRLRSLEARARDASAKAKPLFDKRGQLLPRERIATTARCGRAVAGAVLPGGLPSRHARPRGFHSRRRDDLRHRLRRRRARHGRGERLRHRRRRLSSAGCREDAARAGHRAREQAAFPAPGRVGGRQPAQVPGGVLHRRRRAVLQPRAAVGRRDSGRHRGARVVDRRRRVHARPVRLRRHGARPRQGVSRRTAAAQGRDRRDRHRRGARRRGHAHARVRSGRVSGRGRLRRGAPGARGGRAAGMGRGAAARRQAAALPGGGVARRHARGLPQAGGHARSHRALCRRLRLPRFQARLRSRDGVRARRSAGHARGHRDQQRPARPGRRRTRPRTSSRPAARPGCRSCTCRTPPATSSARLPRKPA